MLLFTYVIQTDQFRKFPFVTNIFLCMFWEYKMRSVHVFVLLIGVAHLASCSSETSCPESTEYVRRLGNTKYYILHERKRWKFLTQAEARHECKKYDLKLAKVRNMQSMAVLRRELEKLGNKHKLRDTWYWLDAVYDNQTGKYYWGHLENNDVVQYSNFLYRPPRPVGIGAHISYNGTYQKELPLEQCLTLAMPWPWPQANHSKIYGFQSSFDERYCQSKTSRHAMCESPDPDCDLKPKSAFEISEKQKNYFEKGNWIMGDRKFIVNWKHRTFEDTEEYCKSLGLQVHTPGTAEKWLIPHVKMWSRSVTNSLYWTDMKYNATDMSFVNATGHVIANATFKVNFTEEAALTDRSTLSDFLYCVALSLSYEFKSQMACPDNSSKACSWSFINYIPSSCQNYHGAICQHEDHYTRSIKWKKAYIKNLSTILNSQDLLTKFGYEESSLWRSKIKQTFGLCFCPEDYRMLRNSENNTNWGKPLENKKPDFPYDYLETYWVVDKQLFNKTENSNCTVAYVEPDEPYSRKFKQVPCTEWHFYLCEKVTAKTKDRQRTRGNFTNSEPMEWRDGPQPRVYPLVVDPIILPEKNVSTANVTNEVQPNNMSSKPKHKKHHHKAKGKKIKYFKMYD